MCFVVYFELMFTVHVKSSLIVPIDWITPLYLLEDLSDRTNSH